jgi:steroid delta-isomerase-like uncharacterized protein
MSEQNKALVRRYNDDFWGKGDESLVEELFAETLVDHNPAGNDLPPGREGMRQALANFRTAFPDLTTSLEHLIAEGDKVVLRWRARGTHEGDLMGIPATGKQVTLSGIDILRIENGKIAERWAEYDNLGLLQQLGVVPEMARA